ncbi:protein-glutamate methylesterase/protein-glutamine glutaminase [Marinobacter zhanjiangensis]|uniref:Protein-glutamate methylesterase/protein-glutamine glutaminase n=1 Tax=Marinobacter zhanjiangensis TaxID=578215 RepID=A0ABQ3APK9_9GAMM|nr:chemotaxis response regulator protein-glutamate methylesterase [Marinobacter zhanjiangensis]GGY59937.1 chemotaxis response regulator protein-glutamate methylesterase 1 [Marinobacter zhanjiangensis]
MIRVLVVDDSALVRQVLTELINQAPDLEVVGVAPDPYAAREKIKQLNPDVITLDVEMPRMDGIEFLEKIMRLRPMPVLMVSSLTEEGNETTLRALELGAVDFVTKPRVGVADGLAEYVEDLHQKLRAAGRSRVSRRSGRVSSAPRRSAPVAPVGVVASEKLILVGASTGGTEAIWQFLQGMPSDAPAILITQHMPAGFTRSFAQRLDSHLPLRVQEAGEGQRLRPGHVYIAPGGRHMTVIRSGADYVVHLTDDPPVNRHRPSVDMLFGSAVQSAAANSVAVMLTGMGDDGARAMLRLRERGASTFAQDEATSVVYGMPREAVALGAVDEELPLDRLAQAVLKAVSGRSTRLG